MGFPLRLCRHFSWKTRFSRVRFRHISRICISKTLPDFLCTLPRLFWRGKRFRLISRIGCMHNAKMHMHSDLRGICIVAGWLQAQPVPLFFEHSFFHNGHSCVNPISNINRKNECVPRGEKEKDREKEKGSGKYYRLMCGKYQDVDASTKTSSRKFRDDIFYERQVLTTWRNSTTTRRGS